MILDKYAQLRIAGIVLDFSMKEFAQKHGTSIQTIRDVSFGNRTSARLSKAIDETIQQANTNYDIHRRSSIQTKTAC